MNADLVVTVALLKKLNLITAKEAENLHDELKYRNLSLSLKDCDVIIDEIFEKHNIGKKPDLRMTLVGNKMMDLEK